MIIVSSTTEFLPQSLWSLSPRGKRSAFRSTLIPIFYQSVFVVFCLSNMYSSPFLLEGSFIVNRQFNHFDMIANFASLLKKKFSREKRKKVLPFLASYITNNLRSCLFYETIFAGTAIMQQKGNNGC